VRVSADELSDSPGPDITSVKALMTVHEKGELTTWGLNVPSYSCFEPGGGMRVRGSLISVRASPANASVFPLRNLLFIARSWWRLSTIHKSAVNRKRQLESQNRRREQPQVIVFDHEEHVRQLRLQITDYSNPTLSIEAIEASAPAENWYLSLKRPQIVPLRLYFGNSKMPEPHYDFEKELGRLKTAPVQSSVGDIKKNPVYTPEPFTIH
jgi:hypothetical protein